MKHLIRRMHDSTTLPPSLASPSAGVSRREFLTEFFAVAGIGLVGGCVGSSGFVESALPKGSARLRFGVLSDIHVRLWKDGKRLNWTYDTKTLQKTLRYFKKRKVDAVVIAGDMADRGIVEELEFIAKAWYSVFPKGCGVEKIFVFGNHDLDGWSYDRQRLIKSAFPDEATRKNHLLQTDWKGQWERIFHEKTDSIYAKTVKGYTFIGQHWDRHDACEAGDFGTLLKPFLAAHKHELTGVKPFFYVQHPHLANTVFGPWAWGHDDGETTKALSAFPNAVAFSGHSHFSETDERAIWQGGFTSLCCSSLRYTGLIDCLRGDVKPDYENGFQGGEGTVMKRYDSDDGQQGLLVEVYDDKIVYERWDFRYNRKLGPDWVQLLGAPETFGFATRKAKEVPPEFASRAAIEVEMTEAKKRGKGRQKMLPALKISWSAAEGTRPYGYRVTIAGKAAASPLVRYVLAQGYNMPLNDKRAVEDSYIILAKSILPEGEKWKIRVEPFTSFGNFGKGIEKDISALS